MQASLRPTGVVTLVEDIVNRNNRDPVQWANPQFKKYKTYQPLPITNVQVALLASAVTGGPHEYVGRSMAEGHKHLDFSPEEWDSFVDTCATSLELLQIPPREKDEVLDIMRNNRNAVVGDRHIQQ